MAEGRAQYPPSSRKSRSDCPGPGPGPTSRHERLSDAKIIDGIRPELRRRISRIVVLDETDTTQDVLWRLEPSERHGRMVLAERQTAGKGRRGRSWQSPAGNIWLSIGWHFEVPASSLGTLGLVVGVCVCRALARLGLGGHGVKWPNDVQVAGAKLGGILVELRSVKSGCDAVIGVGINVGLGGKAAPAIDQPWADLASQPGIETLDRNTIVGAIIEELLPRFDEAGEGPREFLAKAWPQWDVLEGHSVKVMGEGAAIEGRACGITADGALQLSLSVATAEPRVMAFHSGEVSVRRA